MGADHTYGGHSGVARICVQFGRSLMPGSKQGLSAEQIETLIDSIRSE